MRQVAWIVAAVLGTASIAPAAVLCAKGSGQIVMRPTACKKKETAVDLAQFGAVGPKGDTGAQGAPGPQGDPGPLVTTLPSGATLRGAFGGGWNTSAGGNVIETSISYPFPLATDPTVLIIEVGEDVPTGCSGTAAAPGADPGYLCVFVGYAMSNCGALGAYGTDGGGTYRYGAIVYSFSDASGKCEFSGTWAVTAP